jgi:hypothetical protein
MQPLIDFSRQHTWSAISAMLVLGFPGLNIRAADLFVMTAGSTEAAAFARYTVTHAERDPFENSGPVGVLIEASLPDLYKAAAAVGVRTPHGKTPARFQLLQVVSDETVSEEVIGRYADLREEIDLQPRTLVSITPVNYKFHFAGEVRSGAGAAYIYDVAPRKKRPGLVLGRLWMDSETGAEVLLSGRLTDTSPSAGEVTLVRDTKVVNGCAVSRTTHLAWVIPLLGRAEVAITETLLKGLVP